MALQDDSFKMMRLNMIRLPPASVTLPRQARLEGQSRAHIVEFDVVFSLSDDYGTSFTEFDSHTIEISAVSGSDDQLGVIKVADAKTALPASDHVQLSVEGVSGPYYPCRLRLVFEHGNVPSEFKIRARTTPSTPSAGEIHDELSADTFGMLKILNKAGEDVFRNWNDERYVVLDVTSGSIAVERSVTASEAKTATDKNQTALRYVYLNDSKSNERQCIRITERPGLNNSTGQRLWDCAIGMASWLNADKAVLLSNEGNNADEDARPLQRRRSSIGAHHTFLELGAGCGLVSMALSTTSNRQVKIVATDVQETVETTLSENLSANIHASSRIRPLTLHWGPVPTLARQDLIGSDQGALTILATDVLYNTGSHKVLLQTLCELLEGSGKADAQAFIAYKKRTDGDDTFFVTAARSGLEVNKVWSWGEISIWIFVHK
ncbi:hypothetical protein ACM66B_002558 [Microbotryomycetes sp. NB124-2]